MHTWSCPPTAALFPSFALCWLRRRVARLLNTALFTLDGFQQQLREVGGRVAAGTYARISACAGLSSERCCGWRRRRIAPGSLPASERGAAGENRRCGMQTSGRASARPRVPPGLPSLPQVLGPLYPTGLLPQLAASADAAIQASPCAFCVGAVVLPVSMPRHVDAQRLLLCRCPAHAVLYVMFVCVDVCMRLPPRRSCTMPFQSTAARAARAWPPLPPESRPWRRLRTSSAGRWCARCGATGELLRRKITNRLSFEVHGEPTDVTWDWAG